MDIDRNHMTERILNLTLEIIYLLTREDCIVVIKKSGESVISSSRTQSPIIVPPSYSVIHERDKDLKILELTNKIIQLLTGEETLEEQKKSCKNLMDSHLSQRPLGVPKAGSQRGNLTISGVCIKEDKHIINKRPKVLGTCEEDMTISVRVVTENGDHLEGDTQHICTAAHLREWREDRNVDHNVLHKDRTATESRTETLEDHRETPSYVKGESDSHVYSAADLGTVHIKEEPFSYTGNLPTSGNSVQSLFTPSTGPRTGLIFSCSDCEESFDNNIDLLKHQKTHKGKILICSECGKCFSYKSQLVFHKRTHTGEKPFTCSVCAKSFTTSSVLIRHQITHTGEKLFSCPECEKCFGSKSDLSIHQRIHTGLKPYSCYYCGACFNTGSSLARHRRIHTGEKPFPCSQCEKCFVSSSDLVKHMRVHTGERPFPCPECGKCFACKSGLSKHQRTHIRLKTLPCSDGGVSFTAMSEVSDHQQTDSED